MSRRGLCRCGAVLEFRSGPDGYKMRCPGCGSVVRLRVDSPASADAPWPRQRSGILAFRQPAPSEPDVEQAGGPYVAPEDFDFEGLRPGELPVVEMVPLSELSPVPRPSFWRRRWLPLTAVVVVAASTILLVLMLRG
jgi:hypothetical protein